jgi:hypothetical protein
MLLVVDGKSAKRSRDHICPGDKEEEVAIDEDL